MWWVALHVSLLSQLPDQHQPGCTRVFSIEVFGRERKLMFDFGLISRECYVEVTA